MKPILNQKDAVINITNYCNQNCIFCSVDKKGIDPTLDEMKKIIDNFYDKNIKFISLSGGEPTLRKDLFAILKYIKSKGMNIGMITNGQKISDFAYCQSILPYLSSLEISIHSSNEKEYRDISKKGEFKYVSQTLKNLQFLKSKNPCLKISFNIVAFNYNKDKILNIIKFINTFFKLDYHNNPVNIKFVHYDKIQQEYQFLIPSIKKTKKHLIEVLDYAKQNKINIITSGGIPVCLLKGYEECSKHAFEFIAGFNTYSLNENTDFDKNWDDKYNKYYGTNNFIGVCKNCSAKPFCKGFADGYLEHIKDHLSPFSDGDAILAKNRIIKKYDHWFKKFISDMFEYKELKTNINSLMLELNYSCNQNCTYCQIPFNLRSLRESKEIIKKSHIYFKLILLEYKSVVDEIYFTGGEPTLYPNLLNLIEYSKKMGYTKRTLFTNALILAHKANLDKIIDAGINNFNIPFNSYNEGGCDNITRTPDSFNKKINAIKNIIKTGENITAILILTKSNYSDISRIIKKIIELEITVVKIKFLIPEVSINYKVLEKSNLTNIPNYKDSVPHILKSIDKYKNRIEIKVESIPPCLLKGYEGYVENDILKSSICIFNYTGNSYNLGDNFETNFFKKKTCDNCKYDDSCFGFNKISNMNSPNNM